MPYNPIVLILGSGPRVGAAVAAKFAKNGYRVATTSRKGTGARTSEGYLSLQADFSKPDSIPKVFDAVKGEYNAAPDIVVYNAAAFTAPPDADSLLSLPVNQLVSDLNINTISAYVAAQQAVSGWESSTSDSKKTFIYTGNILNELILPSAPMMTLGVGKAASAYWIGAADALYAAKGYRFFYADERYADGKLKGMDLDGPAHADLYAQLATHEGNVPWQVTFSKDKGYVNFKQ